MQRAHQKIARAAGAVAGEDAAGAIGAMRRRREADDEQARARIAEAGDGAAPVRFVTKGAPLFARDAGAVLTQPRTAIARHDCVAHRRQTTVGTVVNRDHGVTKATT